MWSAFETKYGIVDRSQFILLLSVNKAARQLEARPVCHSLFQ